MSDDDIRAEQRLAPVMQAATGLPLVGLTLGQDDTWSARTWERARPNQYRRQWCGSVRTAGEWFGITYDERQVPAPEVGEELARTVAAWGPTVQSLLGRLRVGVVGAGSVGSIVAEAIARVGVGHIVLIDFDAVERVNLDRLLHARHRHIGLPKVEVLAQAITASATATGSQVTAVERSIVEPDGFKAALDCDILFSCVDRPWPRSVLNFIAYAHLIPVVDGGIIVHRQPSGLRLLGADWRAHIAAPSRACLECLGQYDPGLVSAERDGYFDDPSYFARLPSEHPLRRNENVFAFSLATASLEVLQMLTMLVRPLGISNTGAMSQHFVTGALDRRWDPCCPACLVRTLTAKGDRSGLEVTGIHSAAEAARLARSGFQYWLRRQLNRVLAW